MAESKAAARATDPAGHGLGMVGMLAGALAGAALLAAGVATGGAAIALVAGTMLVGQSLANGIQKVCHIPNPTTAVMAVGSADVFIRQKPAVRAGVDQAALCHGLYCVNHFPLAPAPLAEGSSTVLINGAPAGRVGDKLVCSAVITAGESSVLIGGDSVQVLPMFDTEQTMQNLCAFVGILFIGAGAISAARVGLGALLGYTGKVAGGFLLFDAAGQLGDKLGPGYRDLFQGTLGALLIGLGIRRVRNSKPAPPPTEEVPPKGPKRGWGHGEVPCVPADTGVLTPTGVLPITALKVDSSVLAFDVESGQAIACPVTAVRRGSTRCWVHVTTSLGPVLATRQHPFWVESVEDWLEAATLETGMRLRTADARLADVLSIDLEWLDQPVETYNIIVFRHHNYYVTEAGILVHNGPPIDTPGYSNYVLVDKTGKVYYSGMYGPNTDPAKVMARHTDNHNRFDPNNGDRMVKVPSTRTYGESRRMEHELSVQHDTHIGRDGTNYRGNRQYPMDSKKFRDYYPPDAC